MKSTSTNLLKSLISRLNKLGLSPVSLKLYLADVKRYLAWVETRDPLVLPSTLQNEAYYTDYLEEMKRQGLTSSMLKRTVASLKQLGTTVEEIYNAKNPTKLLSIGQKQANNSSLSISDNYIKAFTKGLKAKHLTNGTIKSYKSDIEQYISWVADSGISTQLDSLINKKTFKKYANYLADSKKCSQSTIARKAKSFTQFTLFFANNSPVLESPNNINKSTNNQLIQSKVPLYPAKFSLRSLFTLSNLLSLAIVLSLSLGFVYFGYRQLQKDRVTLTQAYPGTPVTPSRKLSFQGRLENSSGTPVDPSKSMVFKLWNQASGGTELYSTGTCTIDPDADGIFNTQIGDTCGAAIPSSVFSENSSVYLEVTVESEVMTPRQPIASVAYALNSETLQGIPLSSTMSALAGTIVPMNTGGEIVLGENNAVIRGVSGTFSITAPTLSITTATGTNGNITMAPDGTGQINLLGNTTTTNFFNVSNAQLTTGTLINGTANNNNTGYNLINLSSGSSPTSKFSVDATGLTTVGADLYVSSGISLYNNAVSDDTVEAAKFCTGDGETNCVTDFASLSGSAGIWTDGGTYIYPTNGEIVNASGIGIGTNSPGTLLDISNTSGAANLRLIGSGASVEHATTTEYDINYTRTTGSPIIDFRGIANDGTSNAEFRFGINSGSTGANRLVLFESNGTTYQTRLSSSGENSYINANGNNLGIGTSAPAGLLHVAKNSTYNSESTNAIKITDTGLTTIGGLMGVDTSLNAFYIQSLDPGTSYTTRPLLINPNGGNVGIGDTTPSQLFVVGSGDLFQVNSAGHAKAPTLVLGTATIAPTDRLLGITYSAAQSANITPIVNSYTLTGTLDTSRQIWGMNNTLNINGTDGPHWSRIAASYDYTYLSDGNTQDNVLGLYAISRNLSNTISPAGNTATTSAAIYGESYNSASTGIVSNQYGGLFSSHNDASGTVTSMRGVSASAYSNATGATSTDTYAGYFNTFTNAENSTITTGYGVRGQAYELSNQTVGGITTGYGGYFMAEDATTSYGSFSLGMQNNTVTATHTNLYGAYGRCQTNNAAITVTNCYGTYGDIAESSGTITNGYAGYFNSTNALGTSYGVYSNVTGASTTNYGLYTNVSGATNNYSIYTNGTARSYFGGNVGIVANGYLNFGTTDGSSGYGIRDNSGTIEFKNSSGSWTGIGGASKWSDLTAPTANLSINHSTYTTAFDWATGTGTNNLFSLTTAAGSNGTGSLLNIQTGTGSTVSPLRIRAGAMESIFVNNAGNVGVGTINPHGKLHVTTNASTLIGKASLVVDQNENQDILTASASGVTKMTLKNDGTLALYNTTSTISNSSGDITLNAASGNVSFSGDNLVNITNAHFAGVFGAGTATNHASAIMDLTSTTQGMLAPRMTTAQRDAIATPATGLLIYNTTTNQFNAYNGSVWGSVGGTSKWSDLTAPTANLSLNHNTYTTAFDWTTGTGTNNLFSLTTAASSNGTGSLLNVQTGTSSTVYPLRVRAGSVESILVDSAGNVGIGDTTPSYKLDVNGDIAGNRFFDTASSSFYLDPAATGTSLSIEGNIVSNGAFTISSNGNNNITLNAGSGTVYIGTTGAGKLDAGTIDPPYTINGERYATYLSGMTGVKEETTGQLTTTSHMPGTGYYSVIDFTSLTKDSDLWLFSKVTDLRNNINKLVVLLSPEGQARTWYKLNEQQGKLYIYSDLPTKVSYRLTAPRFDASSWTNTRDTQHEGFVLDDPDNWGSLISNVELEHIDYVISSTNDPISKAVSYSLTNSIGQTIENFVTASRAVVAELETGRLTAQEIQTSLISPIATDSSIIISSSYDPNTNPSGYTYNEGSEPILIVDGTIDVATVSARLAQLEELRAQKIIARDIVADTITASNIIGLDQKIATFSADLSNAEIESITDRIKERLALLTGNIATADDLPSPEPITTPSVDLSSESLASDSANFLSLSTDYLAVNALLTVTGESYLARVTTTSINAPIGTTLALGNNTLLIDGQGQITINGDLTVSGKILAQEASFNTLELGSAKEATSSALGNLLSVYNEDGQVVGSIDASGSANLASIKTQLITIAASSPATGSALSNLLGQTESNATAGEAVISSPNTEVIIRSPFVSDDSLVYLTPTGHTDGKILFVKSKDSCSNNPSSTCKKSFTVAIDGPTLVDIPFNWWIVGVAKEEQ